MDDLFLHYKDLVMIFSGIGTFISSLIAVFTLIEVKKQRHSYYKPDILIKTFLVAISKSPFLKNEEELLEYKTCNFNDYSNNYNEVKYEVSAKYKVENLGFGIAKNVKCQWKFDAKKAIQLIDKELSKNFSFSLHKNLNLYFLNDSNNENFHYSAFTKIEKQNIDYIAPINIQSHSHLHTVPNIIMYTHYLFLLFKEKLLEEKADNFGIFKFEEYKFPAPSLMIEYRDLNNKKYMKEYKFELTAVSTQVDEVLDMTKEFAYLEFEIK
jgi:hypothetical protein